MTALFADPMVTGAVIFALVLALMVLGLPVAFAFLGANLIGGLLFGIGWAVAGYCPGTSVGAIGEGRWHALWAVLGMLVGAAVYAEAYPALKSTVLTWGDLGKVTLASVTGINHWVWIVLLSAGFIALFAWFEKKKL